MTNEALTMRIKAGETYLMDELWSQVYGFVCSQAHKFYDTYTARCKNLGLEVEDLQQEAFLAIHKAIEGYDAEKGVTFLTYAGYHLKHAFFSVTKMNYTGWQKNMARQALSLDAPAYTDNEEISIADTFSSGEDVETLVLDKVYNEKLGRDLNSAIGELNPAWQEAIYAIYFYGLRPVELARRQGVARSVVGRKKKRALETLRENLLIQAYANI